MTKILRLLAAATVAAVMTQAGGGLAAHAGPATAQMSGQLVAEDDAASSDTSEDSGDGSSDESDSESESDSEAEDSGSDSDSETEPEPAPVPEPEPETSAAPDPNPASGPTTKSRGSSASSEGNGGNKGRDDDVAGGAADKPLGPGAAPGLRDAGSSVSGLLEESGDATPTSLASESGPSPLGWVLLAAGVACGIAAAVVYRRGIGPIEVAADDSVLAAPIEP